MPRLSSAEKIVNRLVKDVFCATLGHGDTDMFLPEKLRELTYKRKLDRALKLLSRVPWQKNAISRFNKTDVTRFDIRGATDPLYQVLEALFHAEAKKQTGLFEQISVVFKPIFTKLSEQMQNEVVLFSQVNGQLFSETPGFVNKFLEYFGFENMRIDDDRHYLGESKRIPDWRNYYMPAKGEPLDWDRDYLG